LGFKYDIPVHVDSCLGGFLVVFMKEAHTLLELADTVPPTLAFINPPWFLASTIWHVFLVIYFKLFY